MFAGRFGPSLAAIVVVATPLPRPPPGSLPLFFLDGTTQAHIPLALFMLSVVAMSVVPVLPTEGSDRADACVVSMLVLLVLLAFGLTPERSLGRQQAKPENGHWGSSMSLHTRCKRSPSGSSPAAPLRDRSRFNHCPLKPWPVNDRVRCFKYCPVDNLEFSNPTCDRRWMRRAAVQRLRSIKNGNQVHGPGTS
jgi:hypothetical protein